MEVDKSARDQIAHRVKGVGRKTKAFCPEKALWFGPVDADPAYDVKFCPYCGGDATNDDHRIHDDVFEVFCEDTGMSTWRYCALCGDELNPNGGDQ